MPLCLSANIDTRIARKEGKFDRLSAWFNENEIVSVLICVFLVDCGKVAGDSEHLSPEFCYCEASGWMDLEKIGHTLHGFDVASTKTSKPEFLDYSLVQVVTDRKSLYSLE